MEGGKNKKTPLDYLEKSLLRKLGDSNPRYGYPYVSLANWWFQPLTQTSFLLRFLADSNRRTRFCRPLTKPLIQGTNISTFSLAIVCFPIASAKVLLFFESASVSMKNFQEIAIFFRFGTFRLWDNHCIHNRM